MSSPRPAQARDAGRPRRLEGWKVAISIGAAVVVAPVMAVVLLVLLVAALPVLPFMAMLSVGFRASRSPREPGPTIAPRVAFRPSMSPHPTR
jgi:hypothetical protein